jgi:hypothetical protein
MLDNKARRTRKGSPMRNTGSVERLDLDELARAEWRKSSWSSFNGNCVAVARLRGELVGVRDTKYEGSGKVLIFDSAAWRSFIDSVKSGGVIH